MKEKLISPSLLSANFASLGADMEMLNTSGADYIHVDVMDGVFVPNISFGMPVLKYMKLQTKKPLDVHLMIIEPERYIDKFVELGADILTIHAEATHHLHRAVQMIKSAGAQAGVSINPATPVSVLEDIICDVDWVLIMSVNPGFGGQSFIENTYAKIARLREMIEKSGSSARIEIDGGVNGNNAARLFDAGADMLVAGNYVFGHENPSRAIEILKGL
ncbi:MAG: ribulose-phosphate 3-epimerase [Flavobacteriales bacterium]|jgi:ribulose-phosphate 3-epimerase|nr:ribulose-phosphate 3-epimerase [Flavobacteriales bacterium]MBQ2422000.1 ribulose-phosphate 3-epimerase [Flavobacteriales bacterium]MBQ5815668.1 ribulose-phosphate 3-epimerase [Flavobacteriales bacterium]